MNNAKSSKISNVLRIHTHNPPRFTRVVVVVVEKSNEIIGNFQEFSEMCLVLKKMREEHV